MALRNKEVKVAEFEDTGYALEKEVGIRVDSRSKEWEYIQSGLSGTEKVLLFWLIMLMEKVKFAFNTP